MTTSVSIERSPSTVNDGLSASGSSLNEAATEKIVYEYCLLRYVADIEREEFINVGLMMMCKRMRWLRVEICIDEPRLRNCFRNPDIGLLTRQLDLFRRNDVPEPGLPVEERYRWMAAVKSAIIQTSRSHPGLIRYPEGLPSEEIRARLDTLFDTLFRRLV